MLILSKTNNVGESRPERWSSTSLAQRRWRLGVKCLPDIWRAFERVQDSAAATTESDTVLYILFRATSRFHKDSSTATVIRETPRVFPRNQPISSCTGRKHVLMGFAHSLFALPSLSLHSSSFGHVLEKRAANRSSRRGSEISIFRVRSQPGRHLIKQLAEARFRNWVTSY